MQLCSSSEDVNFCVVACVKKKSYTHPWSRCLCFKSANQTKTLNKQCGGLTRMERITHYNTRSDDTTCAIEHNESHDIVAGHRLPPPPLRGSPLRGSPPLPPQVAVLPRPPPKACGDMTRERRQQEFRLPNQQQQLLYVDMMNFGDFVFPMRAPWNMHKSFANTQRFVAAARNAGFVLKCFLDDAQKSVEAVKKWRSRREREVTKGLKEVPQGNETLTTQTQKTFMTRCSLVNRCY